MAPLQGQTQRVLRFSKTKLETQPRQTHHMTIWWWELFPCDQGPSLSCPKAIAPWGGQVQSNHWSLYLPRKLNFCNFYLKSSAFGRICGITTYFTVNQNLLSSKTVHHHVGGWVHVGSLITQFKSGTFVPNR